MTFVTEKRFSWKYSVDQRHESLIIIWGCNCRSASDREVHGVTGKQKSNVELLHAAGGWCSCCFQGGLGTRAVNEPLISFTMPLGPSPSLFGAFSGLLGLGEGQLRYKKTQENSRKPKKAPRRAEKAPRRLEEGPRRNMKLSKGSLTALVLNHP